VREGTYAERLIPAHSGTETQPVTFAGAPGETAIITGGDEPAIFLRGLSWVVVEGVVVQGVVGWARIEDSSHNTLRANQFSDATASGTTGGVKLVRAEYNRILQNTFAGGTDDIVLQESDRNVVEGNTFTSGRHSLLSVRCGNQNVIRDNRFSNPEQKDLEIYDCEGVSDAPVRLDATKRNLVEGNVIADTHPSTQDYRYNGIQFAGQQGIVRRNVFSNNQGGGVNFQYYSDESLFNNRNRVYHNTFYGNRCYAVVELDGDLEEYFDNRVRNNLLYRNTDCAGGGDQVSIADPQLVILADNAFADADPGFVDEAGGDFRLSADSPMIDGAGFLTAATTTGNGTQLPVEDAGYFYEGFDIPGEIGDEIQLEGGPETARVTGVDLQANLLTLDRSLTWTAGQGVSLKYSGVRPDVGAFEASP